MGQDPPSTATSTTAPRSIRPEVAEALANLSPAETQKVLEVLEKAMKRRRIQLLGYLVAAFVLVVGMIGALYYYGSQAGTGFVGWAFLIPLGLCGVVLIAFGKWSERYRTALEDRFDAEQRRKKA
jgi:hypothetical protein